MAIALKRHKIKDGISLTTIVDKKFKSNLILIRFITKLDKASASKNALIPNLLVTSNSTYRTRTELTTKLSSLYGSNLFTINHKLVDNQVIGIAANCICDAYSLENEKITSEVADIVLDCIFNPVIENEGFAKKDFEIRKQELIDSIDAEINDKRTYAIIRANKTIYDGEPSSITAYGAKKGAQQLTPEMTYRAYKKLLKTAQIDITFAGGEENTEAINKLINAFSLADREFKEYSFRNLSPIKQQVAEVTEIMDVNQCKMVMAFKSEFNNKYANRLMTAMLGGTAFSKLFTNVREKYSLCYYCAASFVEGKGVLIIDSGVQLSNIPKAREEIINQVKALAQGDFTDDELKNAALSIVGDYKSNYDSIYDLASWYFVQSIRGDNYSPEQAADALNSVTREDIIKSASSLKLDTVYVMQSSENQGGEQ